MNPYMNEDVMWQRLKDIQREVENSRMFTEQTWPAFVRLVSLFGERAWHLAGLAMRRPPRRGALRVVESDVDRATKIA